MNNAKSIVDVKHACAFTGHRPEKLEAPEETVKKWLEERIRQSIDFGYTDFITGMQKGVDLWAAEILIKIKNEGVPIRIIAACAFEGMDSGWKGDWKKLYEATIEAADEVNYICEAHSKGAYIKRDYWMVDHASKLIAVYTVSPGGTKKTYEYAKKKGLGIDRFKQ